MRRSEKGSPSPAEAREPLFLFGFDFFILFLEIHFDGPGSLQGVYRLHPTVLLQTDQEEFILPYL